MLNNVKRKAIQKKDRKEIETILDNEDFMPVENILPNEINRVIFYLRRVLPIRQHKPQMRDTLPDTS